MCHQELLCATSVVPVNFCARLSLSVPLAQGLGSQFHHLWSEDVMEGGGSLDLQEYFNTWDWLAAESSDGFHFDTRDLLDIDLSTEAITHNKLHTYDVTDNVNIDIHDALDATHHQHLDEIMDEGSARRKRNTETEEARSTRRKLKSVTQPWSLKYNYIFLFLVNFIMLVVYYISDLLDDVPRAVCFIIVLVHLSAIGLFAFDTAIHTLHIKGSVNPKQVRNV
jgi:hypothetical protein